jgi:predicted transcriptional regulator
MAASSTLSIRVSSETRERLEKLATSTRRSKSFLAAEAIDAYVARELEIMEGIERGLEDMRAGRVIPHEQAMARIDATIAAAAKKRSAR